jgi:hypothetical protein
VENKSAQRPKFRVSTSRLVCSAALSCVSSLRMFSLNVDYSSRSVYPPPFRHVPISCARFTVNALYSITGCWSQQLVWGNHREFRYYARRRDHHLLPRCARIRPNSFNGLYDIHTLHDFAKHDMPAIEPPRDYRRNEELLTHCIPRSALQMRQQSNSKSYLRTICVRTGIGHREQPGLMML